MIDYLYTIIAIIMTAINYIIMLCINNSIKYEILESEHKITTRLIKIEKAIQEIKSKPIKK